MATLAPSCGPVPDADRLGGRLVLDEMAGRELRPVLERADQEHDEPWSVVRRVNPVTLSSPARFHADDDTDDRGRVRRRTRIPRAAAEEQRRGARHDDEGSEDEREQVACPPVHRSVIQRAAAPAPTPACPCRCCPARGAACRRRTAGRWRDPARRSAGRAARASGADRRVPSLGEVRVATPDPLRSTRTTHSTISPPIASTAGTIASSEPPVVRMSSTRRTRSPGSIRNPRRNSRCVVPSSARTSSAKRLRTPS